MGVQFWFGSLMTVTLWLTVKEAKANATADGVVFCYYNSASSTRTGAARFGASDIPLDLCTHVVYSSIRPMADGNITFSQPGTGDGNSTNMSFEDFVALREAANASNVKLMASLGGTEEDSTNFSIIVNNEALRKAHIDVLRSFVQTNNLDGIDLFWKYPTLFGGMPTDKVKYTTFLLDLKTTFGGDYLVSAAVGPTESAISASYYVQEINQYVDYINLLSFGYYDSKSNVTGVNAPLYPQTTDGVNNTNNVNASVSAWIGSGASPSKLVLGLGAFGRTFELVSQNDTDTGAPVLAPGAAGLSGVEGELSYTEICTDQCENADQWNISQDGNDSYVYANKNLFWVGYDNVDTIFAKGKYAKNNGLAGIALWSLDLADFSGACGDKYLLLKQAITGYQTAEVIPKPDNNNTTQEVVQSTNKTMITIITDDNSEEDITAKKTYLTDVDDQVNDVDDEVNDVDDKVNENGNTVERDDDLILGLGPQTILNDTLFDGFVSKTGTNEIDNTDQNQQNTQNSKDGKFIKLNVDNLLKYNINETIVLGPGPQISSLNGSLFDDFEPKKEVNTQDSINKYDSNVKTEETSTEKQHQENFLEWVGKRIMRAFL